MTTATDICPGCGREFAPIGFLNHLRLSHDPRCVSARNRLQPRYPHPFELESPRHSPLTDVEMVDLSHGEFVTPSELSSQSGAADMDTDIPFHGDDGGRLLSMLEDGPDTVTCPLNAQAPVVFDSDAEDSDDDDGDQDQTPHSEPETQPGLGSAANPSAQQASQTGKFVYVVKILRPDRNPLVHQSQPPQASNDPGPVRFVVKFAGAGEALRTHPSPVGYQRYASDLGAEENGPTEWAPFLTRRDWEVARWAKLRGPSSTALSELLKIDGVGRPI